jgi:MFS family permease
VIYVLGPAIASEFTPVSQRGAMLTIITAVATSAGLLAPYVMGRIIERGTTPSEGFHRDLGPPCLSSSTISEIGHEEPVAGLCPSSIAMTVSAPFPFR